MNVIFLLNNLSLHVLKF